MPGGRTQLLVQDSDLVKDVKMRLTDIEGPIRLLFRGFDLPDERTLYSLGVGPTAGGSPCLFCVTMVEVPDSTWAKDMVKVTRISGGHVLIPAKKTDTMSHLKEVLATNLGLAADRMRLLHRGMELMNDTCLGELSDIGFQDAGCINRINPLAPIYLLERSSLDIDHQSKVIKVINETNPVALHSDITSDALIERRIDSHWFPAKILRKHSHDCQDAQKVDIKYLDDGNIELGVDWLDCRWLNDD